jgi:hypothetical protein
MRKSIYLALVLFLVQFPSRATAAGSQAVKPGIALTYANDKMTDGAGSQLLRIYGIYAVARYLHVPYVHTPLKQLDYQGLAALEKNANSPHLAERYNRVFTIPSDIELPNNPVSWYLNRPTVADIVSLKHAAEKEHQFYLARILLPFTITDTNPEMFQVLKQVSPFQPKLSDTFRIAIHVRRGEEYAIASDRMLPNSYYITATMRIVGALKQLGIPFVCDLYTEMASKPFVVTAQSPGINGLAHPVVIEPKMNRIEDFDVIPNLRKHINGDPIDALKGMATADALLVSRSTFSWLPALLSKGIILYHPYLYRTPKDWMATDNNGNFSSARLSTRLKAWKAQRQQATRQ